MKEKQNFWLIVSLAVLLAATVAVLAGNAGPDHEAVDPLLFRVADASAIDHVVIEGQHEKIDLHYDGLAWKINNHYEADPQLIKVLMATVLQITPKRPVAKQQLDSVQARLSTAGVTVGFYAGNSLIKSFIAGGNSEKTEAWFTTQKGATPWRVIIPGYRVYASGIFEITANEWREKRIFNFNWRNFRKLTAVYPAEPASGFEIARQEDFLGVVGLDKPDSARINAFLNDILALAADKIVPSGAVAFCDSIAKTTPYLTISVEDIAKRTYRLDLFAAAVPGGMIEGKGLENEIVLFERKKTFPVIKKKGYFRAK